MSREQNLTSTRDRAAALERLEAAIGYNFKDFALVGFGLGEDAENGVHV